MKIGLRIDVDTFRGTKHGVPKLSRLLADHAILASFFFSVGPDNMGRHLWRLFRPTFLCKMLRTKASSLYGWDILLRGTFRPGPVIGERLGDIIRAVAEAGHEVGLHAWDHHAWQAHLHRMGSDAIHSHLKRGVDLLTRILGHPPACSAAPAWKCNDLVLLEKAAFSFRYNSDCRGESLFLPLVAGKQLLQPQVPVTLPTYDELIGHRGVSNDNYNDYLFSLVRPEKLNVLTVHAEVEGIVCSALFERFIKTAQSKGASFLPLGGLLADSPHVDRSPIIAKNTPGREGWACFQGPVQRRRGQEEGES